jgi:hypothetical protein
MYQTPSQLPDLSVDFMSWLNTELRRYIEDPSEEDTQNTPKRGLVNRLKSCFTRDEEFAEVS